MSIDGFGIFTCQFSFLIDSWTFVIVRMNLQKHSKYLIALRVSNLFQLRGLNFCICFTNLMCTWLEQFFVTGDNGSHYTAVIRFGSKHVENLPHLLITLYCLLGGYIFLQIVVIKWRCFLSVVHACNSHWIPLYCHGQLSLMEQNYLNSCHSNCCIQNSYFCLFHSFWYLISYAAGMWTSLKFIIYFWWFNAPVNIKWYPE